MNCPRSRLRIRQMAADTCDTETATRGLPEDVKSIAVNGKTREASKR